MTSFSTYQLIQQRNYDILLSILRDHMKYFRKPRKHLRTNIKKTNSKKLKLSKVKLKEFVKECKYVVA